MISLKHYLDCATSRSSEQIELNRLFATELARLGTAYCAALRKMAESGVHVCPQSGVELQSALLQVIQRVNAHYDVKTVTEAEDAVHAALANWSSGTSAHLRQKAEDIKEMLLVFARAAQSISNRDELYARQINEITERLRNIASLEDVSEIRVSIEQSALNLKASIDRMTVAGKAALDKMSAQVSAYRAQLGQVEYFATCDVLTGIGNRRWMEIQFLKRINENRQFSVAFIDIDDFKRVNDEHGHMIGDELLKQFAGELRAACRSNDVPGRWGGDEFVVLMDCGLNEAEVQADRLRQWICGDYMLNTFSSPLTLHIHASVGLTEYRAGEGMKEMLDRADADMYHDKDRIENPMFV